MNSVDSNLLIFAGVAIIVISVLMLMLLVAIRRNLVRGYRMLAVLFSMLGYLGFILILTGVFRSIFTS